MGEERFALQNRPNLREIFIADKKFLNFRMKKNNGFFQAWKSMKRSVTKRSPRQFEKPENTFLLKFQFNGLHLS